LHTFADESKKDIMDNYEPTKIKELFEEGVRAHKKGDLPIINNHNGKDCFILDVPEETQAKFRVHFSLDENEEILMARDTSVWNNRKTGLVITNLRIVYIPEEKESQRQRYVVGLDSFIRVTFDSQSLLFWNTEETFFSIPAKNFFKSRMKSYDVDRATKNLAKLLQNIRNQLRGGVISKDQSSQ